MTRFSMQRAGIVFFLRCGPAPLSYLQIRTKMPKSTLYYHLEILRRQNLIEIDESEKDVRVSLLDPDSPTVVSMILIYSGLSTLAEGWI